MKQVAVLTMVCGIGCLTVNVRSPTAEAAERRVAGASKVQFTERWFEQSCFGQLTQAMARRRCQEILSKRIELANESVKLSDRQREKLLLGGQADVHRFFSEFDTVKRQFDFGLIAENQWQKLLPEVKHVQRPFQQQIIDGLHGDDSVFQKTLNSLLDNSKVSQIQSSYRHYAWLRYREKIVQTINQVMRGRADQVVSLPAINELLLDVAGQRIRIDLSLAPKLRDQTVRDIVADVLLNHTSAPEYYGNSRHYVTIIQERMKQIEPLLPEEVKR